MVNKLTYLLKTYIISHHSQTNFLFDNPKYLLKTYIISHHSQTERTLSSTWKSLRPILFHIILKQIETAFLS